MAVRVKIDGLQRLLFRFRDMRVRARRGAAKRIVVGFGAEYAVFVHERLDVHHPTGQAKFLEQPARERRTEIGATVAAAVKAGRSLPQALLLGGLRLLNAARALTPVDTGFLRRSGFVRVE